MENFNSKIDWIKCRQPNTEKVFIESTHWILKKEVKKTKI